MSSKAKGSNAERDLVHKFWGEMFACVRVAGSGSMKYPSPDIIASRDGITIALECKTTKKNTNTLRGEKLKN